MKDYRIKIKPIVNEDYFDILNEYWEIKDDLFINKPRQLIEQYDLEMRELNKIVKDNSECRIIYGSCSGCKVDVSDIIYTQTAFKDSQKRTVERCPNCEATFLEEREYQMRRQFEDDNKQREIEKIELEKKNEEIFGQVIPNEKSESLTKDELDIFKTIFRLIRISRNDNENRSSIFREVFKGSPLDREVWAKIGSIEKKGLLVVERDSNGYKSRVLRFTLPHMLKKDFIDERVLTNDLDFISFSLLQRTKNNQVCRSDYAGTFYLDRSVKLNKNVEYVYEGYINTDGSLTLKIQPLYNVENNFNIK